MKKLINVLLMSVLVISLFGCSTNNETNFTEPKFTAGEYVVDVDGHNGVVTVKTVLSETAIEEIIIEEHSETASFANPVFEQLPAQIIEKQSLAIDVIAGSTFSSNAVLNGVEQAIIEAGGNVEEYKTASNVDEERTSTTLEADVIVVGTGIAGTTAALAAQENGATVILLEKMGKTGGTTASSGGMILATNSYLQEGVDDTAEALADYWYERSEEQANYEMLLFAANESGNTINWLSDNGVEFNENVGVSGLFTEPRAITTVNGGGGFIDPLIDTFLENGGQLYLNTTATDLIVDENNNVIGLNAKGQSEDFVINADAVVLATGGYDANPEMLAEYAPRAAENHIIYSNVGNTGDGILMGMEIGADTVFSGSVIGFKGLDSNVAYYTPMGLLGLTRGLVVDFEGSRFYNESLDYSLVYDIWDKHGADEFYGIFDSTVPNDALLQAVDNGYAVSADTLEELAELINMPNLVSTVARYNELSANQLDEDFDKAATFMKELTTGPYYAVTIKNATLGTFGGLKINMDAQVLNTEGNPINGLYASGEVANGEWFNQFYPASGTSISISASFGLVAGENAAVYSQNN